MVTTKSDQDAWLSAHSAKVCPVFASRMTEQACEDYRAGDNASPQCLACAGISAVGLDPADPDTDVAMSRAEPQLREEPVPCADAAAPVMPSPASVTPATSCLSGWALVSQVTGIESHSKLSDAMRSGSQPSISLVFRKVAAGEVPRGALWAAILAYTGLTPEQIMGRPVTPEELLPRGGWPKGKSRKPAAPEAPATEAPAEIAADLDVATGHAEPGSIAEDVLAAPREPVVDVPTLPVCPSEIPLETLLCMVRNRLPGMTVEIRVGW